MLFLRFSRTYNFKLKNQAYHRYNSLYILTVWLEQKYQLKRIRIRRIFTGSKDIIRKGDGMGGLNLKLTMRKFLNKF